MSVLLENKIEYLKGVGPKRAAILNKELGIFTMEDLLHYYPFRYIDKSRIHLVKDVQDDSSYFQLVGTVSRLQSFGSPRATRITAVLTDESGSIELVWFRGLTWVKNRFQPGKKYVIFGKANYFNRQYSFIHPDIDDYNPDDFTLGESQQGVYQSSETMKNNGLGTKNMSRLMKQILAVTAEYIPETLPDWVLAQEKLISRKTALVAIHFPANTDQLKHARHRISFEEYFFFQLHLLHRKSIRKQTGAGYVFQQVGFYFNEFYHHYLPFSLTQAQKRVIREIRVDMANGMPMNRLLQGDVGSGKTIVALMLMLLALDNGFQATLMAPTEILAQQHYASLREMLKEMPVQLALLTGSTRKKQRQQIDESLKDGSLQILIGTHALIEETVVFSKLGLVVIDEQHRFGVAQRARLYEKSALTPHMLVMTATPIPRTLAMTQYGDLDYSQIDELPPGRKPVKTLHFYPSQRLRLIGFMKQQIALGRQIYVVYPIIKESEKLDLIALKEGYEALIRDFPEPQYRICVVHGQLKADDKEFEMQRFIKGQAHIMVATTVIEVGVNIPNASVMVIEHADRFGLSQLHQLRGRVGRGADQSYCILMTDYKLTADGRKRMATMVQTQDGFKIAEADLLLRGPGETQGTRQSGMPEFKLGNLAKDEALIRKVRNTVARMLEEDPQLRSEKHQSTRKNYEKLYKQSFDWSKIG
ncbi:MAG: ATP-dependent DNA helicase RecG [Bacteroidales bacterium]|nr:ATP-dependent DNA helicase RecG [Bacteroidales bacterium]MDD3700778.1 ATP-dependent DNA helicase RecG [Bacteroidales bacterium]